MISIKILGTASDKQKQFSYKTSAEEVQNENKYV